MLDGRRATEEGVIIIKINVGRKTNVRREKSYKRRCNNYKNK